VEEMALCGASDFVTPLWPSNGKACHLRELLFDFRFAQTHLFQ
jgi:hypothetical protein